MEGNDKGSYWEFRPAGRPVLYSKLSRFIMSAQRAGMMTTRTRDTAHTAWEVCDMWHYYQKRKHTAMLEIQKPNIASLNGRPSLTRKWAEAIEGVGMVKGGEAERLFKTPIALANSEEIEWLGISGVGPKTARSILHQIEGARR